MNLIVSIARLREAGIELRADEAVAVTQQLIHNRRALQPRLEPEPSGGPLSIDNLYLSRDG